MNNNIDFDSALYAINQDGSYLHQQDGLWGLFDHGESLDNPVVLYTFHSFPSLIEKSLPSTFQYSIFTPHT